MAQLFSTGFIQGSQTVTWIAWPIPKGEVDAVSAYPTDGVVNAELSISGIRYLRYVDGSGTWRWKILFDLTNRSGNGVDYEIHWTRA